MNRLLRLILAISGLVWTADALACSPSTSANLTVVTTNGPAIVDANCHSWTLVNTGGGLGNQVYTDGVVNPSFTAQVSEMAFVSGAVWQENSAAFWWFEILPTDTWLPSGGTSTAPNTASVTPSANNTTVTTAGYSITDGSGNLWTLTASGQVAVNGVVDATTSNVIKLAYVSSLIYQENSAGLWFHKAVPSDSWAPPGGSSTSPLPANSANRVANYLAARAINNHMGFQTQPFDNPPLLIAAMSYIGFTLIRDSSPEFAFDHYTTSAQSGLLFDFCGAPGGNDLNNTLAVDISGAATIANNVPGSVVSYEGPNEMNGQVIFNNGASSADPAQAIPIQSRIFNAVEANSTLVAQNVQVIQFSVYTGGNIPLAWQTYVANAGNIAPYDTKANWHQYYGSAQPRSGVQTALMEANTLSPGRVPWMTETGYCTDQVDQLTQAKNLLNVLADAYDFGFERTFIYELMDDPTNSSCERNFGVITATSGAGFTPKTSGVALHNESIILHDPAANATSFVPGSLAYTTSNLPSVGHTHLFERADGTFFIQVWVEQEDWNSGSNQPIAVPTINVVVNLPSQFQTVQVYDPIAGTTPTQNLSNVSQVTLPMTDHVMYVAVSGAPTPPPSQNCAPYIVISN